MCLVKIRVLYTKDSKMWEREEKQKAVEHFEGANERKRVSQTPYTLQPCETACLFWERTHF